MAIWHIFPRFGTFLPFLVCCTTKNLATLISAMWHWRPPVHLGWFAELVGGRGPAVVRLEEVVDDLQVRESIFVLGL
jgi:hypothetical protein